MAFGVGVGALFGLPLLLELAVSPTLLVATYALVLAALGYLVGKRDARLVEETAVDPLTQVLSARGFAERLAQEIDRAVRHRSPLSMLLIRPRQSGARVLRELAALLRTTCRSSDLVAQHDGEALAVLTPCTRSDQAEVLAERIADLEATPEATPKVTPGVTIGVAELAPAMREPGALFDAASQALLIAQVSGRDVFALPDGSFIGAGRSSMPVPKHEHHEQGEQDEGRSQGAAIRAHEILDETGRREVELSVYCAECATWQPVLGRRRSRFVERALHRHEGMAYAEAGEGARVGDLMTRRVVCVRPQTRIAELTQLFLDRDLGGAPVVDEAGRVLGVISRGDVLRGTWQGARPMGTVADLMTSMVFQLPETAPAARAAALMAYEGVERIVVVSADQVVVGMLSSMDVMRWVGQQAGYVVPGPGGEEPGAQPAPAPAEEPEVEPGGEVVMVVDDDDDLRDEIASLLREEGYRVVTAANGREAMERLRETGPPRLILLDLQMPVMNGWSFCNELQKSPVLGRVPLVVLSGLRADRARLDVDGFLAKPVAVDQLLGTVKQYVC